MGNMKQVHSEDIKFWTDLRTSVVWRCLLAEWQLYRFLYVKGENAIIILKILVTTVQNLCTPEILPPNANVSTRNFLNPEYMRGVLR